MGLINIHGPLVGWFQPSQWRVDLCESFLPTHPSQERTLFLRYYRVSFPTYAKREREEIFSATQTSSSNARPSFLFSFSLLFFSFFHSLRAILHSNRHDSNHSYLNRDKVRVKKFLFLANCDDTSQEEKRNDI